MKHKYKVGDSIKVKIYKYIQSSEEIPADVHYQVGDSAKVRDYKVIGLGRSEARPYVIEVPGRGEWELFHKAIVEESEPTIMYKVGDWLELKLDYDGDPADSEDKVKCSDKTGHFKIVEYSKDSGIYRVKTKEASWYVYPNAIVGPGKNPEESVMQKYKIGDKIEVKTYLYEGKEQPIAAYHSLDKSTGSNFFEITDVEKEDKVQTYRVKFDNDNDQTWVHNNAIIGKSESKQDSSVKEYEAGDWIEVKANGGYWRVHKDAIVGLGTATKKEEVEPKVPPKEELAVGGIVTLAVDKNGDYIVDPRYIGDKCGIIECEIVALNDHLSFCITVANPKGWDFSDSDKAKVLGVTDFDSHYKGKAKSVYYGAILGYKPPARAVYLKTRLPKQSSAQDKTEVSKKFDEEKVMDRKYKVGDKVECFVADNGLPTDSATAKKKFFEVVGVVNNMSRYSLATTGGRRFDSNDTSYSAVNKKYKGDCANVDEIHVLGKQSVMGDLVDNFKDNGQQAAYRATARKLTKETRTALSVVLKMAGAKNKDIKLVQKLVDSEFGLGLIGVILGLAFRYVPGLKDNEHAKVLSNEFQIEGMTTEMVLIADKLQDTMMPLVMGHLSFLKDKIPAPPTNKRVSVTAPVVPAVVNDEEAEEEAAEFEAARAVAVN